MVARKIIIKIGMPQDRRSFSEKKLPWSKKKKRQLLIRIQFCKKKQTNPLFEDGRHKITFFEISARIKTHRRTNLIQEKTLPRKSAPLLGNIPSTNDKKVMLF